MRVTRSRLCYSASSNRLEASPFTSHHLIGFGRLARSVLDNTSSPEAAFSTVVVRDSMNGESMKLYREKSEGALAIVRLILLVLYSGQN